MQCSRARRRSIYHAYAYVPACVYYLPSVADPGFEPWVVLTKKFQMQYGINKTKSINSVIRNDSKQFGNNQKCINTLKISPNNNLNWTWHLLISWFNPLPLVWQTTTHNSKKNISTSEFMAKLLQQVLYWLNCSTNSLLLAYPGPSFCTDMNSEMGKKK